MRHAGMIHSRGLARVAHGRPGGHTMGRTGQDALGMAFGGNGACAPVSNVANQVQQNCGPYGTTRTCREYYLGFDSEPEAPGGIAPGASLTVTALPQEPFVGLNLIVPSIQAPFFVINSITVGRVPQFVAVGAVSAEVFSSNSFRAFQTFDPADRGTQISINVTNIDTVDARRFTAALLGQSQPFS